MTDITERPNYSMCGAIYTRPNEVVFSGPRVVMCTFFKGHNGDCSWKALLKADEEAAEEIREMREAANADDDPAPTPIRDVLDGLNEGKFDPYIEAILAAGHSRKRALRGVREFPNLTGRGGSS